MESVGGVLGVCEVSGGAATIRVAARGPAALGAVLAHEATHAWVAEAFGEARNGMLNEGLAQYFAALAYPPLRNEIRHAWLNGGSDVMASPYIAGFHWIEEHVESPRFPDFFRRQIGRPTSTLDDLDRLWRESPNGN